MVKWFARPPPPLPPSPDFKCSEEKKDDPVLVLIEDSGDHEATYLPLFLNKQENKEILSRSNNWQCVIDVRD